MGHAMLCSIHKTKSNPPKKWRYFEATYWRMYRLCTTKNDKKAFVVQEVIFHTYYTCFYVIHLFKTWTIFKLKKKLPLIFLEMMWPIYEATQSMSCCRTSWWNGVKFICELFHNCMTYEVLYNEAPICLTWVSMGK